MKHKKRRTNLKEINIDKLLNLKKHKNKSTYKKSISKKTPKKERKSNRVIKQAKAEQKKVSSGIPKFDALIEGGFEKNSANVVVGGSGSGKTILATQFLIEGMKQGEKCLYVTFEEKKEQFYKNMLEFGWNLEEYEKKKLFTFLEYTPVKVKAMLDEGGGAIETAIIRQGITRIVIDSITSFALLFEKELEKREAALMLFNMISEWHCTSLLTLEEDPLNTKETPSKTIEFESDSIILIYFTQQKGERKRYIEILKMRGVKHSKNIYEFEIGSHGVNLLSKRSDRIE